MLTLLLTVSTALAGTEDGSDESYDHYFRGYTTLYFGQAVDWRLFKAQGRVESRLIETAVSHRGASGVMQIMPATYREIQKKNPYFEEKAIDSAKINIGAGIYYASYLHKRWDKNLTEEMQLKLMLASYNAGYVRVLRAYKKANKPVNDWQSVSKLLPKETRLYVTKVFQSYHKDLGWT